MGAVFRVPLVPLDQAPRLRRVALDARGAEPLEAVDCRPPLAFDLGAERAGLPAAVLREADVAARVPQGDAAESLNVAMAGTIALYETSRQARAAGRKEDR
jgi:TrmH family RNA methyltransferase